jgi:hypothetical protein
MNSGAPPLIPSDHDKTDFNTQDVRLCVGPVKGGNVQVPPLDVGFRLDCRAIRQLGRLFFEMSLIQCDWVSAAHASPA